MAQQTMAKNSKVVNTKIDNNNDIEKEEAGGGGIIVAVLLIVLLFIFIGAGLCYWFNVFGVKDKVYTLMGKEPETTEVVEKTQEEIFAEREAEIAKMQADVDSQKLALEQKQSEIDAKLLEISQREQKYLVDKAEFDALYEAFEKRKQDVKDVAKIYEQMDASVAAEILIKYSDKNEVAKIISNLTDSKAAEILAEMDAKYASDLLRVIE